MTRMLCAALALSLLAAPAWAGHIPEGECHDLDKVKLDIRAESPQSEHQFAVVDGPDAVFFMAKFNAAPPPSDVKADVVLLATSPAMVRFSPSGPVSFSIVVFFLDGCQVSHAWIRTETILRWLTEAGGRGA